MNPDLGLGEPGCLEVLKGRESEAERVSDYHRGLGSSAGLYISPHQLFFIICQLLLCLLTDSLAAACGTGKGTCQNYTCSLSSSANSLITDGEFWKQGSTHSIATRHMDGGYEVCTAGQSHHRQG